MNPNGAGEPPIKIGGEFRGRGKGPHDDVEVRVAYALIHAPTLASFLSNVELREFRINQVDDGWRLMLKGKRGREHQVAFFYAENWRDLVTLAVTSLDTGRVDWYHDRYPPK